MPENGRYFEPNFSEKSSKPKGSLCPSSKSVTEIEKMLKVQKHTDSRTKLSAHYHKFLNIFNQKIMKMLASARNREINY